MFSGRIFHCLEWQMRLNLTGSGSPPFPEASVGWKGTITTSYTPDLLTVATGIRLESEVTTGGGPDQRRFLLALPSLGVAESRTLSGLGLSESLLTLFGFELYARHTGTWRLKWSGMEWRINGALVWSRGAGQMDSPMPVTPASIPLLGIPALLEGGATTDSLLASGCLGEEGAPSLSSEVEAVVTGGWRFRDDEGYVSLPVTIDQGDAPGVQPIMTSLSGTSTWDLTVNPFGLLTSSASSQSQVFGEGWILASPDLCRDVFRLTETPACLVVRGGFPRGRQIGDRTWWTNDCESQPLDSGSESSQEVICPSHTEMLEVVREGPGVIEEPLLPILPAPCGRSGSELWNGTTSHGARSRSVAFGPHQDESGDVLEILNHPDWRARWVNTWLSPHWSYFLWMPPAESAGALAWPALGEDEASPEEYWLPLRQQMLRHHALPEAQNTSQRVSIILEPLDQNGLAGLISGQYLGRTSSWWGVPRFEAFPFSQIALASVTLDSSEFWSFSDGLGTVDSAGLAMTGDWAEADLARWDASPYRTAEGMKWLDLPTPENSAAFQWKLIASDGAASNLDPGLQPIPWAKGKKGAGSWIQDFGASLGSDQGIEVKPGSMISSTLFSSPDHLQSLGLLGGREGVRLRLEAAPLDPGQQVICGFPTLSRSPWEDHLWLAERSASFCLLDKEGPGIRWGDLSWWNSLTDSFANPPLVKGVTQAMTALDFFCQRRVSLEGIGPEDGLDAEIASLFAEGEEYTQRAHLARDPIAQALVTHACLLPGASGPVGVVQNTYRSAPPLPVFPHKDRDEDLAATSLYTAKTWTASEAVHWCVAPASSPLTQVALKEASGGPDLLDQEKSWDGWSIRGHQRTSDGMETASFCLSMNGKDQAKVRPYRGFFFVPGPSQEFRQVWCTVLPWGHLHRTESLAGGVTHARFLDSWTLQDAGSTIDPDGEQGKAVVLPARATLMACWVREGAVLTAESWDDGETWTSAQMMIENALQPTLVALNDGRVILMAFRPDPSDEDVGTLAGRWRDPGSPDWSSEAVLQDESGPLRVQRGGFHALCLPEPASRLALTAVPEGESSPAFWWSADEGRTWTRGTE